MPLAAFVPVVDSLLPPPRPSQPILAELQTVPQTAPPQSVQNNPNITGASGWGAVISNNAQDANEATHNFVRDMLWSTF
jgi:hypothetical protein